MGKKAVLDTLWKRINERGDFPTLQRNISNIVSAMHNEEANTSELVSVVLSDFTLTQQVIRLANSAMYSAFGGNVSTVSRALAVLGVDAIGHLALGLQLLENFSGLAENQGMAGQELHRVLVASEFARKVTIGKGPKEAEEAVVCTLLQSISRLLVVFYFPQEWVKIQQRTTLEGLSLSEACKIELGISFEDLAQEVTQRWRLPQDIAQSIQTPRLDPSTPLDTHGAWLNAIATLSSNVAEGLLEQKGVEELTDMLAQHAEWLGISADLMVDSALDSSAFLLQLRQDGLTTTVDGAKPKGKPSDANLRLLRNIRDVSEVANSMHPNVLAPLVLESWMQSMGFEKCFCMFLNYSTKRFEAKIGFGEGVPAKLPRLGFAQGFVPDVFHIALTQSAVVFISDTHESQFSSRLPKWYHQEFEIPRSFIILPLQLKNKGVGLFYGDWGSTLCPKLSPEETTSMYKLGDVLMRGFERLLPGASAPSGPAFA